MNSILKKKEVLYMLMSEEYILSNLNHEQKEVVLSYGTPILTIAGAGSGKCVNENTRIHTNKGYLQIKELEKYLNEIELKSDNFYDFNTELIVKDGEISDKFYCNGYVDTIKLTSKKFKFEATPIHPIRVLDKEQGVVWKELQHISVGDLVCVDAKEDILFNYETPKPQFLKHLSERDYGWFVGFFMEEGYGDFDVDNKKILKNKYETLCIYLTYVCDSLKKYNNTDISKIDNKIFNKNKVNDLIDLGICGKKELKRLPNWIFSSNREFLIGLLSGYLDSSKDSYSEEFITDIRDIFNLFGIYPELVVRKNSKQEKYKLNIDINLNYHLHSNLDILKPIFNVEKEKLVKLKKQKPKIKINDLTKTISNYDLNNYEFIKVESVETSKSMTYDISVPTTNTYTANGIVSHNTTTLTKKICHLNKIKNIPLERILAITFTNKASVEMQERVTSLLKLNKKPDWISTFHALSIKILKGNMSKIGFKESFTIYDGYESKSLIKSILDVYLFDNNLENEKTIYSEDNMKSIISRIKLSSEYDEGMDALKRSYPNMNTKNKTKFFDNIEEIFKLYQARLKANNSLDFDDMLVFAVKILKNNPDIKQQWQSKFDYILVDEYQDTNGIQYELLKLIIGNNRDNVMVVGDPFQCVTGDCTVTIKQTTPEGEQVIQKLIKDVEIGDKILTQKNNQFIYSAVTKKQKYSDRPVLKIKTSSGHSITMTPNHRCFTLGNLNNFKKEPYVSIELNCLLGFHVHIEGRPFSQKRVFSNYTKAYRYAVELQRLHDLNLLEFYNVYRNSEETKLIEIQAQELQCGNLIPVVIDEKIEFTEIVDIRYMPVGDVYDIEISDTGILIANDIVSHNSIYEWRGARAENILSFDKDFKNTKIIKLENNYRSTSDIINFANRIVSESSVAWKDKLVNLRTDNKTNSKDVLVNTYSTDEIEAQTIANQIQLLTRRGNFEYKDFTVLLRMSFISRIMEQYFIRSRIPYHVVGGLTFYERAEIKVLLNYLKFACNPNDRLSFEKIISVPSRSIGVQAIKNIEKNHETDWIGALKKTIPSFRDTMKKNVESFVKLIEHVRPFANEQPCDALRHIVNKIDFHSYLENKYPDNYEDRINNVNELINILEKTQYDKTLFMDFLTEYVTKSDQDSVDDNNCVKIMTIHASKGLEFPVVFIPAMEDDVLPSYRANDTAKQEEERRLFYVAVTRAKKMCFISYARMRGFNIQSGKTKKSMSRFLNNVT